MQARWPLTSDKWTQPILYSPVRLIEIVDQMLSQGHESVQSTKEFSEKDLQTIEISEIKQRQFKELVATSKDFSEPEKAAIEFKNFDTFWEQATNAKESFDRSHEKGCGLWSKRYQSSAVDIKGFMEDFSPVIGIVKDFGAPYGSIAVGVISVLFTAAGNKGEIEERLASTIAAIKDRLPGLKLYQHIYNDDHELDNMLQAKIVSVYHGFIDFCIAATKYYKSSGHRRWLRALRTSNSFTAKANKVQEVIVATRHSCEELLDKNVHSIKTLTITQKENIEELKAQVKQLQEGHDNYRLREIQQLLNLDTFSDEVHDKAMNEYRHAVDSDDQLNAEYFQRMQGQELERFKDCRDYQSWIKSDRSCLLILSGYNNQSIYDLDQCWLSPVAMATLEGLRQQEDHSIYAYYVHSRQGEALPHVLSVILLQLLRRKSHALRNERQHVELCAELQQYQKLSKRTEKGSGMNEDDTISALHKVAIRVIRFFEESDTVYIIVDRVDRCRDVRKADHRKALLKALVKMVEAAPSKLRILAVVNGWSWRVEDHHDELGEQVKGKVIIHTAHQALQC